IIVAGPHKNGRVAAVGSYRLFSNYGAGLFLRNNKTFAMNIFRWLAGTAIAEGKVASSTQTPPPPTQPQVSAIVPPKTKPASMETSPIPPTPPSTGTRAATGGGNDQAVIQEIEGLRAEISEMRDIIARLYSDSLGYLQEMKEEVRSMLDYIRTKEG
ncbi:MAG: hypothetical protein ACTSQK_12455, partial [Candidatus Heimdallarchaeota archaeon]